MAEKVNTYDIGAQPRLRARFYAIGTDALADPTDVHILVRTPAGAETAHAATKESTGVYYHDLSLTTAGDWYYRGNGTGAVVAAGERKLIVRKSNLDDPLATP